MQIFLFIFFMIFCNLFLEATAVKRCDTGIEIRHKPKMLYKSKNFNGTLESIYECTEIDGDFTISMIHHGNHTNEDFPVFNNLQVITGSLLVYSATGLTNLGYVLPSLKVIGGQSLISKYAFVVYQNDDLRFIGLKNLQIIRNGGVRITDNRNLCYSESINWENILIGNFAKTTIEQNGENCEEKNECQVENHDKCQQNDGMLSCWDPHSCQIYCPYHKLENNQIGPGCSLTTGEKCYSTCLGGCEIPNDPTSCFACRKNSLRGECIEECPPNTFEYLDNRCLTKDECHNLRPVKSLVKKDEMFWKTFQGKCNYECPDGYQEDPRNRQNCVKCEGQCPPQKCLGARIYSIENALMYEKCNIIDGNLEFNIQYYEKAYVVKFTQSFGNIREITGYLQIHFSPIFTSFRMFKNLQIIHGKELVHDRYAIYVMEMENLRELFDPEVEKNLHIKNGLVSFHNNAKLCYNRIMNFVTNVKLVKNITDDDISKYSNGEKAFCEKAVLPLNVEVTSVTNVFFVLSWKKFNTRDMDARKFFGYFIYWKKVDSIDPNMNIEDDGPETSDSWKMKFVPGDDDDTKENQTEWIQSLDPNSIYAYYVQTKVVRHAGAKTAISKIGFAKTLFFIPDKPQLQRYEAIGPNKIKLEWDPPLKPNGIITHYMVTWKAKTINSTDFDPCGTNLLPPSKQIPSVKVKYPKKTNVETSQKFSSIQETFEDTYIVENAHFEDSVLNYVYTFTPSHKQEIEYSYFDHYNLHTYNPKKFTEKVEKKYPEIFNENKTFGKTNISSTGIILTGLLHFTDYQIQIFACQDITAPENYCSKYSASEIVRTDSIPENDVIDFNTIIVGPYALNGTESEESRIISCKIPQNPNGQILGFRYKVWKENDKISSADYCISKTDYEKSNGILIRGLTNGIYSFEIRTVTSAGISKSVIKKNLFEFHGGSIVEKIFYFSILIIIILAVIIFFARRYFNRSKNSNSDNYAKLIIPGTEQENTSL